MTTFTKYATEIWRRYVTDGVPASGRNSPDIDEIRVWGGEVEAAIGAESLAIANNLSDVASRATARQNLLGSIGIPWINATLSITAAASALTIALKTQDGGDPATADPVTLNFRSSTPATGDYTPRTITAATSLVLSSGSTLGTSNSVAFHGWVVAFDDAGTIRLGVINCRSSKNIYPLGAWGIASSTAEGGAGGADSAHTFYTGTAVTSKAYIVLGYFSYESGLATAGTWSAAPTRVQMHGPDVPLPGHVVQRVTIEDSTGFSTTSTSYVTTTLTGAITLSSAANLVKTHMSGNMSISNAAHNGAVALHRGGSRIGGQRTFQSVEFAAVGDVHIDAPNSASALTYAYYSKISNAATTLAFPWSATGEAPYGVMTLEELMV